MRVLLSCVSFLALLPFLPLQTVHEVNTLRHTLREENSEYCCVNNHEIMIKFSFFDEDNGGPLAAARAIFV